MARIHSNRHAPFQKTCIQLKMRIIPTLLRLFVGLFFISQPFISMAQQWMNIEHQGLEREYILYIPEELPENAPLVIMLHGYTGHAMYAMDYSEFNALAEQEKFVVCYPLGTKDDYLDAHFWNVGYDFHDEDVDDLSFLIRLAEHLQSEYDLDKDRTFCTGFSNGGDMSFLLACQAPDVFRAVAPVAGALLENVYNECGENMPIPIFMCNGTEDDITLFEGDIYNYDGWGSYFDSPFTLHYFAELNECQQLNQTSFPDIAAWDGSTVNAYRYVDGINDNEVWLYEVDGGAHEWPGYDGNQDIHLSTEIWKFFQRSGFDGMVNNIETEESEISLHPNPVVDVCHISSNKRFGKVSIYNLLGEQVFSFTEIALSQKLDLAFLPNGMYYLSIGNEVFKLQKVSGD